MAADDGVAAELRRLAEAVEANNALAGNVLRACETMVQVCTNIDATCRKMLAACEPEDGDGGGREFFETMKGFTTTLTEVAQGVKSLPAEVSSRVSGDVAEAVRLFGSEVETAPA